MKLRAAAFAIVIFSQSLFPQQGLFQDRSTALNIPPQSGNYGVSVIDYNKDGWDDIFIANTPGLIGTDTSFCVLLRNNYGENFTNVAHSAGIRRFGSYKCGVWGDINNDGFPDLFIAEAFQLGRSRLFLNNKNGTFTEIGSSCGINFTALASTASFGDYDNDGRIDLFITTEFPEYDLLYRNISRNDTIQFQDVTDAAGVGGFSSTAPMQATFIDIDHDGDQDLYAVHDGYLPSNLFRNNGDGTFSDISFATGLYDYGAGNSMGVYWKDFDYDGWEEVYVTRIGKGGLYTLQPNGKYLNIADSVGAEFNGMSWGLVWEDFDNDGDDDIFIVNNYGYNSVRSLYYENANGIFFEKAAVYGINFPHAFYGLAYGDFNNDGYLDLVASGNDGNNKLLLNSATKTGNWLKISLTGTIVNRMAIGTTVRIVTGSKSQRRTVSAGNSYASQVSPTLHFGLGAAAVIDTVEIIWSKNDKQTFVTVNANVHYQLQQGNGLATGTGRREHRDTPDQFMLKQNYPNPFNPNTVIEYTLDQHSFVTLSIYDLVGRRISQPVHLYHSKGNYSIRIDASELPSGSYIYQLISGNRTEYRKMTILK